MRILMLVNWKIEYCDECPADKQPPDYYVKGSPYWFFRYFRNVPEVDVIDIRSFPWLERVEKEKFRFYIWQALRSVPRLNKYDLIVSHGMQSGVVISLWRRFFKTKAKHVVFDIGSFNSASESGTALKLMQFASRSLDGVICHMSGQLEYYERFFPWLRKKARFIRYGADLKFFQKSDTSFSEEERPYIICVGRDRCDWNTVVRAHLKFKEEIELRLIGGYDPDFEGLEGVCQFPRMPVSQLIELISGAILCVLPLEYVKYSFGQMRLLQQMAMEKCVIVSDVPSVMNYVKNYRTGILYEPHNVEDLSAKIGYVLAHPMERKNMERRAGEYVRQHCNEEIMAGEIEKYFMEVLR